MMGVFSVRVRISSAHDRTVSRELEMVVDTGATYTMLPGSIWRELGIRSIRRMRARLANGEFVYRDLGEAIITCEGRTTGTWVLLGEEGDVPLLGAYSLEGLGLEVDPMNQELRPADAYLLTATG